MATQKVPINKLKKVKVYPGPHAEITTLNILVSNLTVFFSTHVVIFHHKNGIIWCKLLWFDFSA